MKKIAILLVFSLLLFTTCRKQSIPFPECSDADRVLDLNLQPEDAFYFSKGWDYPQYKMQNGELWFLKALGTQDTFVRLPNHLFLQAQKLMSAFPKQLKDAPFLYSKGNCSNPNTYRLGINYSQGQNRQPTWYIEDCGDATLYPPTICYLKQIDFILDLLPK